MIEAIKDLNLPFFHEASTPFLYGPPKHSRHSLVRRCDAFLDVERVPRKLKKRFKRAEVWPPRSFWFRGLGIACLVRAVAIFRSGGASTGPHCPGRAVLPGVR